MEANSIGQHDGGDSPPHRGDPPSQEPEANKWGDADMKMIEAAMMVQIPSLFSLSGVTYTEAKYRKNLELAARTLYHLKIKAQRYMSASQSRNQFMTILMILPLSGEVRFPSFMKHISNRY